MRKRHVALGLGGLIAIYQIARLQTVLSILEDLGVM